MRKINELGSAEIISWFPWRMENSIELDFDLKRARQVFENPMLQGGDFTKGKTSKNIFEFSLEDFCVQVLICERTNPTPGLLLVAEFRGPWPVLLFAVCWSFCRLLTLRSNCAVARRWLAAWPCLPAPTCYLAECIVLSPFLLVDECILVSSLFILPNWSLKLLSSLAFWPCCMVIFETLCLPLTCVNCVDWAGVPR